MRYLEGQPGSIFYGGEEFTFPGGKQSEDTLDQLWFGKLSKMNIPVSAIMEHANKYIFRDESNGQLKHRFSRSES